MKRFTKRLITAAMSAAFLVAGLTSLPAQAAGIAKPSGFVTAYEKYGAVKVAKDPETGYQQLCDKNGNPIQLKGMSTFGLQWGDGNWVLNDAAFDALAYDWKCDIVRLAMYVTEGGYASDPEGCLARVEKGIQLATARGMYVLVDWHILNPGNPSDSQYLTAGVNLSAYAKIKQAHPNYTGPELFFAYLSQKYGAQGNVLFETGNEPNGNGSESDAGNTWKEKLRPYHQKVVNAIRTYDKDNVPNVVICGTDSWSQFVDAPAANPVTDPAVSAGKATVNQIMYTLHFYAGTHDLSPDGSGNYWLRGKVQNALSKGLAVFCTEWGTSEASGNGGPYLDNSDKWLSFLEEKKISWCAWSLALKDEVSAAMKGSTNQNPSDTNGDGIPNWNTAASNNPDLSATGIYLRKNILKKATYNPVVEPPKGTWKKTSKGWWYSLTAGGYPKSQWMNIDGKLYYFDAEGYMESDAYRNGYYLNKNGVAVSSRSGGTWKNNGKDWWFVDDSGWHPVSRWLKVDGKFYYFKATGFLAKSEFVDGWWLEKNGVQSDPKKYSWHKTSSGWWYGIAGGWYAKSGLYVIDNKVYRFNAKGYCMNP